MSGMERHMLCYCTSIPEGSYRRRVLNINAYYSTLTSNNSKDSVPTCIFTIVVKYNLSQK